jgi:hypothetical protein
MTMVITTQRTYERYARLSVSFATCEWKSSSTSLFGVTSHYRRFTSRVLVF